MKKIFAFIFAFVIVLPGFCFAESGDVAVDNLRLNNSKDYAVVREIVEKETNSTFDGFGELLWDKAYAEASFVDDGPYINPDIIDAFYKNNNIKSNINYSQLRWQVPSKNGGIVTIDKESGKTAYEIFGSAIPAKPSPSLVLYADIDLIEKVIETSNKINQKSIDDLVILPEGQNHFGCVFFISEGQEYLIPLGQSWENQDITINAYEIYKPKELIPLLAEFTNWQKPTGEDNRTDSGVGGINDSDETLTPWLIVAGIIGVGCVILGVSIVIILRKRNRIHEQ